MAHPTSTSTINPLRIAEIDAGEGGRIGVTFAPGKVQPNALSGCHRRDLQADLDVIAAWNAAAVITLCETHELEALRITAIAAEVPRRHMEWHHWPICDGDVPDAAFDAAWSARAAKVRSLLACGARVLIHCKGGQGRAGMVAARLLVEGGMEADAAIATVREVRDGAIETRGQERWVAAGRATVLPQPFQDRDAARDRALGSLLGLAVGDALGAAIEFEAKPRFAKLDGMVAGGPHRLMRGQWTDDTAMALALADSLIVEPNLDPSDLMDRFVGWWQNGTYSCTGTCFDIGGATREALDRYRRSGAPLAGSPDPNQSGNGALMRLAPVAVRHWRGRETLLRVADLQTRTTHGSPAALDASRRFAEMLADAVAGVSLPQVLARPVASIEGGWRGLHRDAIEGSGYVVRSLQAAVWAVSRTTNFRDAVLLAANLGDDADTTAAVAGQLAGAVYGSSGIPQDWLDTLAWRGRIEEAAGRLFDKAWPIAEIGEGDDLADPSDATLGAPFAGCHMTADWTLGERLGALAEFRPMFDRKDFVFAEHTEAVANGGVITMGFYSLTDEGQRFYKAAYDYGWVRNFDYHAWSKTEGGERLLRDPSSVDKATEDDIACLLTVCIRADRFCEGYLVGAYESGMIRRIVVRADELLALLERRFGSKRPKSGRRTRD